MDKPIECLVCGERFAEAEIEGHSACPSCKTLVIPCDRRKDVILTINPHELRTLTIWADNYARQLIKGEVHDAWVAHLRLLDRLRAQLPGVPLTMEDEVKKLAEAFETRVVMTDEKGDVIHEVDGGKIGHA